MKRYTYCYDQVLITGDQDDSSYMLRKLQEEYNKWGLTINMQKTEYMAVGTDEADDLDIGNASVKRCNTFKYYIFLFFFIYIIYILKPVVGCHLIKH